MSLYPGDYMSALCHSYIDSMPPDGLLNSSTAGFGNPWLIGVDLICNKTYISSLVSKHFSMVLLKNL